MNKTYIAKKETIEKAWHLVDARDAILGRVATRIAMVLRGKHKPTFTPHVDTGDNVVVINVDKLKLTGKKLTQKYAYRNSGFPGGATFTRYDVLMKTRPEKALFLAVRGMLPKNKMRDKLMKKLHLCKGEQHPHIAQNPQPLDVNIIQ